MRMYVVNAFAEGPFQGNPAAVCAPGRPLTTEVMQAIAAQNNLSETAYITKARDDYAIRWFTPASEVDLCGHATLASAYVILNHLEPGRDSVVFSSQSGPLSVTRRGELLALNFPARPPVKIKTPDFVEEALGVPVLEAHQSRDLVLLLESEEAVRALSPDMSLLARVPGFLGICVTAPGLSVDFVSRYFAPLEGIPEDPVTGSSHCTLVPFWSKRLQKSEMTAKQLSKRGGALYVKDLGERVEIAGKARLYLEGVISIE